MTYEHLRTLCAWVDPFFLVLLIVVAWAKHPKRIAALRFLGVSLAGLLIACLLAHTNRLLHLWKSHLVFPSGHMSFYVSVATSLVLADRRWIFVTVPGAIGFGFLLVLLGYHSWLDVVGAWFMASLVTWLCHRALKRRESSVSSAPTDLSSNAPCDSSARTE